MAKPLFYPIVVENGQSNRGFADPSGANESDWTKVFNEIDCLLD